LLQAQLDELQKQEDASRAAAAAAAQGQPLADALERATAAETRVHELEKQNRRLERSSTKQLQRMQEFTAKHATAVETVLEGVAEQAAALQQTANTWQVLATNAKGFKEKLQSLHLDLVCGIDAKPQQDTSNARLAGALPSGASSCHMHLCTSALHTPMRATHVHM
jgi:predicted RNase H-like nuclease (RuvC/YqgF family)